MACSGVPFVLKSEIVLKFQSFSNRVSWYSPRHGDTETNWFATFRLWIASKCVWRPGYARTLWGKYSSPDLLAIINWQNVLKYTKTLVLKVHFWPWDPGMLVHFKVKECKVSFFRHGWSSWADIISYGFIWQCRTFLAVSRCPCCISLWPQTRTF